MKPFRTGIALGLGLAIGTGVGFVLTLELIEWLSRKGLRWPP